MELLSKQKESRSPAYWNLVSDILSQAITGELIGMSNFASLAETIDDVEEMMEAVEHADSERKHAEGFMNLAKKYELVVNVNIQGNYWRRVREAFLKWARKKDFIACLLIQEVMLESMAVSMYRDVGEKLPGELGMLFSEISKEEEHHLEHSISILQEEMKKDQEAFIAKAEQVHLDCMTILAEMSAKKDIKGHCEVCQGSCMKESLPLADLDIRSIRGNSMNLYIRSLDRIGLPTEKTTVWMANLPA
jgi:rubrerythrin